jgi:hypothetical protein
MGGHPALYESVIGLRHSYLPVYGGCDVAMAAAALGGLDMLRRVGRTPCATTLARLVAVGDAAGLAWALERVVEASRAVRVSEQLRGGIGAAAVLGRGAALAALRDAVVAVDAPRDGPLANSRQGESAVHYALLAMCRAGQLAAMRACIESAPPFPLCALSSEHPGAGERPKRVLTTYLTSAAGRGHLHILQWLHGAAVRAGADLSPFRAHCVALAAVEQGRGGVLAWLRETHGVDEAEVSRAVLAREHPLLAPLGNGLD